MDAKRREELRKLIAGGASKPPVTTDELLAFLDADERVEQALVWLNENAAMFGDAMAEECANILRGSHD